MLMLLSLVFGAVMLSLIARRRLEEVLAPFLCGLMLVLYGLSIFQLLALMDWIAPAAAVLLAGCWLVKSMQHGGKNALKETAGLLITPGMLCFVLTTAVLVVLSRDHVVHSTDDIYYWSIEAHSIFAHNGLVNAARHLSPRFMTYTPGMQLWQWVGLHTLGEWSEACMYAVLWVCYMAFLLPLTKNMTWRKWYLIPLVSMCMICIPTLMNVDAYDMLRVDTMLSLCMGYAMVQAYRLHRSADGRWELTCFGLALCALVLLKQIGIAWSVMAMLFVWIIWKPDSFLRRWHLAVTCAAPLLVFVSWKVVCSQLGLTGVHLNYASGQIAQMTEGTWRIPEWLGDLPQALWNAMTAFDKNALPMLLWLVILLLLLGWITHGEKEHKTVLWFSVCAVFLFVIAYIVILIMSIFADGAMAMTDIEFMSMLTNRYGNPLPLGLFMLALAWVIDSVEKGGRARHLQAAVLAVLVLVFARWSSMYENFVPEAYAQETGSLAYETELSENFWVEELEGEEPGVILYGTEYPPYIVERLQYVVAPHKVVVVSGYDMDEESFLRTLEYNGVSHIVCMDDMNAVYENAMNFTEDGWLDVCTVYTVSNEDGEWLISY